MKHCFFQDVAEHVYNDMNESVDAFLGRFNGRPGIGWCVIAFYVMTAVSTLPLALS